MIDCAHSNDSGSAGNVIYDRGGMEIIGSGLDATEIYRIADAIERYGDRFVRRVFTDEEIAYCSPPPRLRIVICGAVCREGSGDEGARHRPFPRSVLAWYRGRPARWPAAICVSMTAPRARCASLGASGSLLTLTHSRELAIAHVLLFR